MCSLPNMALSAATHKPVTSRRARTNTVSSAEYNGSICSVPVQSVTSAVTGSPLEMVVGGCAVVVEFDDLTVVGAGGAVVLLTLKISQASFDCLLALKLLMFIPRPVVPKPKEPVPSAFTMKSSEFMGCLQLCPGRTCMPTWQSPRDATRATVVAGRVVVAGLVPVDASLLPTAAG